MRTSSKRRRRGRIRPRSMRRSRQPIVSKVRELSPELDWGKVAAAATIAILAVAAFLLVHKTKTTPRPPTTPQATVIADDGSFEAAAIPSVAGLPATLDDVFTRIANRHGSVRRIDVNGDGAITTSVVDLTPHDHGEVLKVPARAAAAVRRNIDALLTSLNTVSTSKPGRSLLSGLQQVRLYDDVGPVIAFTTGLDLNDPLDFRVLGWETDPAKIVVFLRQHDELPDLHGRQLLLVFLPPSGDQPQLRAPQQDYLHRVWTAIGIAAGATVSISNSTSTPSRTLTRTPIVGVPPASGTPIAPTAPGGGSSSRAPMTCVVSSPAYFRPNEAVLIDRADVVSALARCAAKARTGEFGVSVEGHVAEDTDGLSSASLARGAVLARKRARVIASVLTGPLKVPAKAITSISGYGADKPLIRPATDPRNRAVVLTFHAKQKGQQR